MSALGLPEMAKLAEHALILEERKTHRRRRQMWSFTHRTSRDGLDHSCSTSRRLIPLQTPIPVWFSKVDGILHFFEFSHVGLCLCGLYLRPPFCMAHLQNHGHTAGNMENWCLLTCLPGSCSASIFIQPMTIYSVNGITHTVLGSPIQLSTICE